MPFVAYQILSNVVQSEKEKYVLHYFWLKVPQKAVAKHIGKWNEMLRQFDAQEDSTKMPRSLQRPLCRPRSNSGEMAFPQSLQWMENGKYSS